MEISGATVVVTGGGGGIGKALAEAFAAAGAQVAVGDIDETAAQVTAEAIGGLSARCDVAVESDTIGLIDRTERELGPVDIFCSNAGIALGGDETASDADWDRIWRVNVLSHIFAARAVLPSMLERGRGHLLQTTSAAGLLTQLGSAPYAVTKHAAVGFAEFLAITYGPRGIGVSMLAPQAVRTAMTDGVTAGPFAAAAIDGMLEADTVAALALDGIRANQFLILPHPEVATYMERKATDYDRWIAGMQRLQSRLGEDS